MSLNIGKKLAIVGATGVVFAGGIVGLTSLASAHTPTVEENAEQQELYAEEAIDGDAGFDLFSIDDQELIIEFENCLSEAGLGAEAEVVDGNDLAEHEAEHVTEHDVEFSEEDLDKIDAAFEVCEDILDGLSFDADEWLEVDEWLATGELSEADQAVFEEYDDCIGNVDSIAIELDEPVDIEVELTDAELAEIEEAFEACDAILENLSEDASFIFDYEELVENEHLDDNNDEHDGDIVESVLET